MTNKNRAFLKWPGGKYALLDEIKLLLPERDVLVEPFTGGSVLMLNTDFEKYILADINPDLINLYKCVKEDGNHFIKHASRWFTAKANTEDAYYKLRDRFNRTSDIEKRSYYFLALNRHCFNGVTRYSKKIGKSGFPTYNVPFGKFDRIYYPEKELILFHRKAQRATFLCEDFRKVLDKVPKYSSLYLDPPYSCIETQKTNFTGYYSDGFSPSDHIDLRDIAINLQRNGTPVLISNHDTPVTRKLYSKSKRSYVEVRRSISRNGAQRNKAKEVLALYDVKKLKQKKVL